MSEQNGAPAPTTPIVPAVTPAAAPPIPAGLSTTPQPGDENQPWFKERLARAEENAKKAALAELGIKDPAKAKEILTAAEKAAQEAKTTGEKLGETSTRLKELEEREASHLATFKAIAEQRMAALTEAQRKAVIDAAGDEDHETQILIIDAFAPTWAAASAQAATAAAAASKTTPAVVTPPATGTAPPANAPPGTVVSQPNHKEVHAALQKTNPFAAAEYALAHLGDVFPEQPSQ